MWSVPDVAQPPDGRDQRAFRSGLTFDLEREGGHLERLVVSLEGR